MTAAMLARHLVVPINEKPARPARFPARLPEFFIRLLTEPGDLVVDIFGGSNTTGHVRELEHRKWLTFEERQDYLAASVVRFLQNEPFNEIKLAYETLMSEPHLEPLNVRKQTTIF